MKRYGWTDEGLSERTNGKVRVKGKVVPVL